MTYQYEKFSQALRLLNGRLQLNGSPRYNLIICGGSALAATGLITRTTKDVDIVALMDDEGALLDPSPLPKSLVRAALEVAIDLGLPNDWLNNGPSNGDGGLFRMGLPEGFVERLTWDNIGERLTVGYINRYDQIHFKLYAAVDQSGSYHAEDLRELIPTDAELLDAAMWTRSHDSSEGYLHCLQWFLREFGYGHLVDKV
jgi:hypothetical protein